MLLTEREKEKRFSTVAYVAQAAALAAMFGPTTGDSTLPVR